MIIFNCRITKALEISEYLQSQGLKYAVDYTWDRVKSSDTDSPWSLNGYSDFSETSQYSFTCNDTKYETFIALRYK